MQPFGAQVLGSPHATLCTEAQVLAAPCSLVPRGTGACSPNAALCASWGLQTMEPRSNLWFRHRVQALSTFPRAWHFGLRVRETALSACVQPPTHPPMLYTPAHSDTYAGKEAGTHTHTHTHTHTRVCVCVCVLGCIGGAYGCTLFHKPALRLPATIWNTFPAADMTHCLGNA